MTIELLFLVSSYLRKGTGCFCEPNMRCDFSNIEYHVRYMVIDLILPLNTASVTIKITRNRKTLLEVVIFFPKFRTNFRPQFISLDLFCGTDNALFPDSCNLQSLYMMIGGCY